MSQLPSGWTPVALGELVDISMGQAPPGITCNKDGVGTPFVKAGEFTASGRPVIREWTTAPLKRAKKTDILVCVVGATCGKVNFGEDCAIGRSVAALSPLYGVSREYLFRFLSTRVSHLRSGAAGSAQGVISKEALQNEAFPLAPEAEQHRIVAKLDQHFEQTALSRDELAHILVLVEHYKQAVLRKAFSGELTASERTQASWQSTEVNSDAIDGRSEDLLVGLPNAWRWTSMDQVVDVAGGLTKNAKRNYHELRVPYLRVANVYANELRLEEIKEIGCSPSELKKTLLQKDDLLIVEGNGSLEQIGRVAIWDGSISPCSHQNHLIRARSKGLVPARYILYWLLSPIGRQAIERVASSSAGLHTLSITKVSGVPIPIASYAEAELIVRKIDAAMAWIDSIHRETSGAIRLLAHLDGGILAKAFRGELGTQDPNDEPAATLLERVRAEREAQPKMRRGRRAKKRM